MTTAELLEDGDMTPRHSIERLADCAPVASAESWVKKRLPGPLTARDLRQIRESKITAQSSLEIAIAARSPYIDDTPVMRAAHAALEAEGRATARAAIKMRARAYALEPRQLDAINPLLFSFSPAKLVLALQVVVTSPPRWFGNGSEVPAINLRAAMLYARYERAKARRNAQRAA